MEENLYPMIFKRKSFHLFKDVGHITLEELDRIRDGFFRCEPLIPEIKVEMKIVPASQTTCSRGQNTASCFTARRRKGIFLISATSGSSWI